MTMPNKPEPSWEEAIRAVFEDLYNIGRHEEAGGLTDRVAAFDQALAALTDAVEKLVKEAMPKEYLDCENYPNSATRCNKCYSCKNDDNKDFEIGMNYGTDTYQTNLINLIRRDVK